MSENNKDDSIDISPVTEKSKRINKFVIMVIVFVIGALVLYLVFGGKEKKKPAPESEVTTTTNTTSFITPEDMQKLAGEAQLEREKPDRQSRTKDNSRSVQPQQPQQLQGSLTLTEKNEMERQRREWENAQKAKDIRAKEDTAGHRSEIFFKIPALDQKKSKKSEPTVNQYYNSGDENYIQVVGGGR